MNSVERGKTKGDPDCATYLIILQSCITAVAISFPKKRRTKCLIKNPIHLGPKKAPLFSMTFR